MLQILIGLIDRITCPILGQCSPAFDEIFAVGPREVEREAPVWQRILDPRCTTDLCRYEITQLKSLSDHSDIELVLCVRPLRSCGTISYDAALATDSVDQGLRAVYHSRFRNTRMTSTDALCERPFLVSGATCCQSGSLRHSSLALARIRGASSCVFLYEGCSVY